MKKVILEICCGDVAGVAAAVKGGADRVELCSALGEGGLTPSAGAISEAVGLGIPVNVLIRPRRGDFVYTPEEVECMMSDIRFCAGAGVNGVVLGALTPDGDVDEKALRRMVAEATGMEMTFHRAIDVCRCPEEALETAVRLGFDNILTSGMKSNALEGAVNIGRLVDLAKGRIHIIAGCGVNPGNAAEIIRISGADAIHSSCSMSVRSGMRFRRAEVRMGNDGDEYAHNTVDVHKVLALRSIVDGIVKDN